MDLTATLAIIAGSLDPIESIGLAVFAVLVGIKVQKWIRRAL